MEVFLGTETISLNGSSVETLKEILGPGLPAVFVGLNPSLVSEESRGR
jgi:hypothetical protein